MSDDDFRRMSESQLIDMTLAAGQGSFGGAERGPPALMADSHRAARKVI
jgi:hypothetical protein